MNILLNKIKNKDFLYNEYIIKNKSRKEICSELNISENSLKYYIKKYKIHKDSNNIQKNKEKTIIKKYGERNMFSTNIFKEKASLTWIKKYGVNNPSKNKTIKNKQNKTYMEHCLSDKNFKINIENKRIKTNLQKYGVKYFILSNEYKKYYNDKTWLNNKINKEFTTKKKNTTYNKSKEEDLIYHELNNKFGDVKRQYKSKQYPYPCDFYIPSKKLYIEYQGFWTHGKEPFNNNDINHIKLLNEWKEKSINKPQYKRAYITWSEKDVNKRKTAKDNNLNWIEFFSKEEFDLWLHKYI